MMNPSYVYRSKLNRVIDGDTYLLDVDLGFRVFVAITVRLRNLYAAESNAPGGKDATQRAYSALFHAQEITLATVKDLKSFDRWIADIWVDGKLLADVLNVEPPQGQGVK